MAEWPASTIRTDLVTRNQKNTENSVQKSLNNRLKSRAVMTVQSSQGQLESAQVESEGARTQTMRTKTKTRRTRTTSTLATPTTGPNKTTSAERTKRTTQDDTGSSTTAKRKRKSASERRDGPMRPRGKPKSTSANSLKSVRKKIASGKRPSASKDRRKLRSVVSKKRKGNAF